MTTKMTVLRGLRVEDLGQALEQSEHETGHDRAHDRAHAADHHHREHHDDQVGAHRRLDLVDRRGQHAGQGGQGHAEAVGQRDHARHIDAEGLHQRRVFGAGPQIGAQPGLLDHQPGGEADDQRGHHHPGPVVGQEHEAQVPPREQLRDGVGQPGNAVDLAEHALDDQGQAEGQQQPVEMVEVVEPAQEQAFHDDAEGAHHNRGDEQRQPVVDPEVGQADPRQ